MPRYVEKIRVLVRLARTGSPIIEGHMSLLPRTELRDSPETLLECLGSSARVMPLVLGNGDVLLVARAQIAWVEAAAGVDPKFVAPAAWMPTRREQVRVGMAGGEEFEGVVSMEMPHEFNRVSDWLNNDDAFFAIELPTGTRLVGKAHVADVRVRDAQSLPRAA